MNDDFWGHFPANPLQLNRMNRLNDLSNPGL